MAKLTKDLFGVVNGKVYPEIIPAGAECPPELEEAARAEGALDLSDEGKGDDPAPKKAAAENKAAPGALENKGQ